LKTSQYKYTSFASNRLSWTHGATELVAIPSKHFRLQIAFASLEMLWLVTFCHESEKCSLDGEYLTLLFMHNLMTVVAHEGGVEKRVLPAGYPGYICRLKIYRHVREKQIGKEIHNSSIEDDDANC
jgi:hypothetical protein